MPTKRSGGALLWSDKSLGVNCLAIYLLSNHNSYNLDYYFDEDKNHKNKLNYCNEKTAKSTRKLV